MAQFKRNKYGHATGHLVMWPGVRSPRLRGMFLADHGGVLVLLELGLWVMLELGLMVLLELGLGYANTLSCACPTYLSVLQSKEAPKRLGFSISCHCQVRNGSGSLDVLKSKEALRCLIL